MTKKTRCLECGHERSHELIAKHFCECSKCHKKIARYLLDGKRHGDRPVYVDASSRLFHGQVCPDCRTKDVIRNIKNRVLYAN